MEVEEKEFLTVKTNGERQEKGGGAARRNSDVKKGWAKEKDRYHKRDKNMNSERNSAQQ